MITDITIPAVIQADEPQSQQTVMELAAMMKAQLANLQSRTTHVYKDIKRAEEFSLRRYMADA